ncbi:MAG: hypothetical protein Sapg2KO_29780 [Saprospiraceae bacterium]
MHKAKKELNSTFMSKFITTIFLITITAIYSCSPDDQNLNLKCDQGRLIKTWSNPEFIAAGKCYLEECLECSFKLNADSSYQLEYAIIDTSMNLTLREFKDSGNFIFDCLESGSLSGKLSALSYTKGDLILKSDSLPQVTWEIEWNSVEGLIIQPEYLGFTHNRYIMLN